MSERSDRNAEHMPESEEDEQRELVAQQARQAVALGRMRYVLALSVVLVAIMFALIWFRAL
ncbi:MAG TPA: hypothetical protein VMU01_05195 [Rhizomicrobium sp.]|nr:hypothetical protein [Rhizomicrobium sp.]